MIYLYVKTHNLTGLKYLGKTEQDPYIYKGSGYRWKRHLKKHGYDISTQVIFQTEDKEIFKNMGIYFSELWNIVESKEWANLKPEAGDGGTWAGLHGEKNPMYGTKRPQYVKDASSRAHKGIKNPRTAELNRKKRWWTDGIIDKCQPICPEGFSLGRSQYRGKKNPFCIKHTLYKKL